MKSLEGKQLIAKIQKDLIDNGIQIDSLIEQLKELRKFSIADEDPTMTKVLRLTYEHLEDYETFHIPIPDDEYEGEIVEAPNATEAVESLNYMLSLMADRTNKVNIQELKEYRDALLDYDE
jgi:hypothetical protein